jgi:glycerol-3-phosphate dehydrogenase
VPVTSIPQPETVDLFVVGGGINGVGIARDAAGRGLSVVLAERGDLAGGTSSASSKLVHGGLRYLEHYEFRLVREALAEREVLMRIAPHLVRPLRFVVPFRPGRRPAWLIRLGLFLYDRLGGKRSLAASERIDLTRGPLGDGLRSDLRYGFAYSDCRVDDARLAIVTARDAEARGARILTRTAFTAARREEGVWIVATVDRATGATRSFRARALVNAAGPWVAEICAVSGVAPRRKLRLVKGSHVVVPRLYQGEQAYLLPNADGSVVFVIPFEGRFSLVGTTEVTLDGAPGPVAISPEETEYLRGAVANFLQHSFAISDVVWSYAGIRPLYDDGHADAGAVTRDYLLELDGKAGEAPLLSVFGGKITTHRRLAEQAIDRLRPYFTMTARWTADAALPGGRLGAPDMMGLVAHVVARWPQLPPDLLRRLTRRHGGAIEEILAGVQTPADLGRHFGGRLYQREVEHFLKHEWAATAEDILWRRTKEGLHMTPVEAAGLASWLAAAKPLVVTASATPA